MKRSIWILAFAIACGGKGDGSQARRDAAAAQQKILIKQGLVAAKVFTRGDNDTILAVKDLIVDGKDMCSRELVIALAMSPPSKTKDGETNISGKGLVDLGFTKIEC